MLMLTIAMLAVGISLFWIAQISLAEQTVTVYKDPTWGCCDAWVGHLQDQGFAVKLADVPQAQLIAIKNKLGVPQRLHSCHTGVVENYVIEGHVPGNLIARLLKERPDVMGLAVPGMPIGSPGMEGPNPKPYDVLSFDKDGRIQVYEHINPAK
jgi:hypothetical protein